MSAHRDLRIELPDVSLSALAWGPPGGPLAVCLHGFPDTAWTWRHLGPALAERGWRVVAPFTRGYAPSSVAEDGDYHVGALMHDAVGVHAAMGGDDAAVLIGHDWGAVTSNALAAHRHSPFRAVVSMSVPPMVAWLPRRRTPDSGIGVGLVARQLRLSWYAVFNQLPWLPERLLDRLLPYLWQSWSPGYDAVDDVRHVTAAIPTREHRSAILGYYRAPLRAKPSMPYRSWHVAWSQAPAVPTMYLHGADDGCITARIVDRVRRVLPDESEVVTIPDAGHFLHLERPDVVNQLIVQFLSRGARV